MATGDALVTRPRQGRALAAVPNVSEGRDGALLGRLLSHQVTPRGAHLLDVSIDADHNRTVLTLAGPSKALEQTLYTLYSRALAALDLTRHSGVHPRFGVVDVCPLVPLPGASLLEAAEAAHHLARRVGESLQIPVYLYGAAARDVSRRELPDVRRQLRLGAESGARLPMPDFGPRERHPTAGVTVIGARSPLVAFNARLATADVEVARRVARRVRASSGGMVGVRALGVHLASQNAAQVTMNLVDPGIAPPARALEAVLAAAREEGVEVVACELVGLVPEAAARDLTTVGVRLEGGLEARLLEPRLRRLGLLESGKQTPRQTVERA